MRAKRPRVWLSNSSTVRRPDEQRSPSWEAVKLLLLLLVALPASGEPLAAGQAQAIDSAIRALLAERPSAGLSVAVRYGDAEWMTAYGYAQLSPPKPATPQTSYRIASVTKTLTGVAIMQLVEQGKVSLDAELQTYLPRFPKKPWPITVRDLLTHVSGIYHYRDQKKEGHFKRHFSTEQSLALFRDWPLAHEPGTKFLYTTYGYDVLGAIVEAVSGESYGEYLRAHICAPANMVHTAVEDRAKLDRTWAAGYRVKAGRLVPSEQIDISSRFAGGGVRSTVEDLVRYGAALLKGQLVKPATWEQMQVSGRTRDGRWVDYGLGFGVFPQHGHFVVSHLGGQPETTSLLILLPAHQLVIALITNVEGQSALLSDAGDAIVETLLEDGVRRRPLYADDPVDQVLLEGMNRVFSYGLARREGWGGELQGGSMDEAFTQLALLLSREHIASDPEGGRAALAQAHHVVKGAVTPRTGAAMALVLEQEFPDRRYATLGPIRFFADYAAVCARRECPGRLSPKLRDDLEWLAVQWEFAGAKLGSYRPERAADARELSEGLTPLLEHVQVHPDFVPELSAIAARWREQAREAEAVAVLELSARLHPSSKEAQLQLADSALLLGDEERAAELYEQVGPSREALAKRAVALEQSTHPRAAAAAQWLKALSSP